MHVDGTARAAGRGRPRRPGGAAQLHVGLRLGPVVAGRPRHPARTRRRPTGGPSWRPRAWSAARPAARSIARSTIVYGPGDADGMLARVARLLSRHVRWFPGDGLNRVHLIHVDDLVAALVALGERGDGVFVLGGPTASPIRRILGLLADGAGLPAPEVRRADGAGGGRGPGGGGPLDPDRALGRAAAQPAQPRRRHPRPGLLVGPGHRGARLDAPGGSWRTASPPSGRGWRPTCSAPSRPSRPNRSGPSPASRPATTPTRRPRAASTGGATSSTPTRAWAPSTSASPSTRCSSRPSPPPAPPASSTPRCSG